MTEQVASERRVSTRWSLCPLPEGGIECWPSHAALRARSRTGRAHGVSDQSRVAVGRSPGRTAPARRLVRGTDYDLVVLGISIGGARQHLPAAGRPLPGVARHDREGRYRGDTGDATLAVAAPRWPGLAVASLLVVNYEDPASNWLDASQVIPFERLHSPDRIGCVFLLRAGGRAGLPQAGPHTFPEDQRRGVQHAHQRWIEQHAAHPMAGAWRTSPAGPLSSTGICCTIRTNRVGRRSAGLAVFPRERRSRPTGSCSRRWARPRFRLRPDDSGVGNLYLAGDWTHNEFNGGCVEGNVMSGLAVFTCDCRISTPLLRRTPLRDLRRSESASAGGAALSPNP